MKASFRVISVLALVALLAAVVVEAGAKKSSGSCRAGDRICPAGEGQWLCWSGGNACPKVQRKASRSADIPDCDDDEKLCQVGEDDYICIPADQECPEPDLLLVSAKGCAGRK